MENEVVKLLKDVSSLWKELHGEAYYDLNGGQDFDRAIELLEAELQAKDERIAELKAELDKYKPKSQWGS